MSEKTYKEYFISKEGSITYVSLTIMFLIVVLLFWYFYPTTTAAASTATTNTYASVAHLVPTNTFTAPGGAGTNSDSRGDDLLNVEDLLLKNMDSDSAKHNFTPAIPDQTRKITGSGLVPV